MTADAVAEAVTARTRGIVLVHFVGIPCDMPSIMRVAERHTLRVVEDCALALGARWEGRHVGLFGDAGCFSFYPVKHLTTAEGGMFVSRHRDVATAVSKLRAFGVDRSHGERSEPGMYDVLGLGLNYRMSELQAALGRSQLRRMGENLQRRSDNFERLRRRVVEVPGVRVLDDERPAARSSHYCLTAVLDASRAPRRREIVARLNAAGVGTSIYYPHPVPRMTYYRERYPYESRRYAGAEQVSDRSVALPTGPHVSAADADYIGRQFLAACLEGGA
jgi:dTDP-4-amino-4,6-dideoxygalactose transaminase